MVLYLRRAKKTRPKEDRERTTEDKKFHNKKLGNLYSFVNITKVTKLKSMTGMCNTSQMKKNCKCIQILEVNLKKQKSVSDVGVHNFKLSHPRCVYINNRCGYQSITQQYLKKDV